jgi:hypothetical protein
MAIGQSIRKLRKEIGETEMPDRKPRQLSLHTRAIGTLAIIIISLIALAVVVAGALTLSRLISIRTIEGSGNAVTRTFDFSDFTGVDVGGGFEVEITQSSSYSVSVTADNNTFDYIDIYKADSTLTIGLKSGFSFHSVTLKTKISMPNLYALVLSGGTQGTAREFTSTHDFSLVLSGGSSLELEGAASNLNLVATGGSRSDLSDFPVHNASVVLSGGSQAAINLDDTLDANLSGGSQLQYIGTPTMGDISVSGGSTITKK